MPLRDKLKQDLDALDDRQLQEVEYFLYSTVLLPSRQIQQITQAGSSGELAQTVEDWVSQFAIVGPSLSDSAFDRESVYDA